MSATHATHVCVHARVCVCVCVRTHLCTYAHASRVDTECSAGASCVYMRVHIDICMHMARVHVCAPPHVCMHGHEHVDRSLWSGHTTAGPAGTRSGETLVREQSWRGRLYSHGWEVTMSAVGLSPGGWASVLLFSRLGQGSERHGWRQRD